MDPSPQLKPINKDMEALQTKPTNKGMEEGEAPHNARTASISTIGTCVSCVVLMCLTGTPARLARQNAASLAIKKDVTGVITANTSKQATGCK